MRGAFQPPGIINLGLNYAYFPYFGLYPWQWRFTHRIPWKCLYFSARSLMPTPSPTKYTNINYFGGAQSPSWVGMLVLGHRGLVLRASNAPRGQSQHREGIDDLRYIWWCNDCERHDGVSYGACSEHDNNAEGTWMYLHSKIALRERKFEVGEI